jgi:hypothetical protein
MARVWDVDGLTAIEKLVLLAIADVSDDDGRCPLGADASIARKTGLTVDALARVAAGLKSAGLLSARGVLNVDDMSAAAITLGGAD